MLLRCRGITKTFGDVHALRGVNCEIEGRAVGLLGPNGAGKTTLMKVCLGLLAPNQGEIEVLGIDVRAEPLRARSRLGYAAEGPGRIPGLSGLESVAFAAELCGISRRRALLRAHEMLDLVSLDESRYRDVETYSTGMHQRVKVAMALVHDPDLVLLDEPTSGLDPDSRDELLDLITRLRDGEGPAILLSTHLLHDVERTCDACIIMHEGVVKYAGALDALQRHIEGEFDVRLSAPIAAFAEGIEALGGQVVKAGLGLLRVTLPSGDGPRAIWSTAAAVGASIVHLEPRAASLEEAFMRTLKES
jgi:ABC-2 type transport system ATP-binding protein